MSKLFERPYAEVIRIYNQYLCINAANDIAARTRLLRKHPEIFDAKVREEIEAVAGLAKRSQARPKIIDITRLLESRKTANWF